MSIKRDRVSTKALKKTPKATSFLSKDQTPTQRLGELLRIASSQGIKPLDQEALDGMGAVWPEQEDLDDFLSWLRKSRQEERN